MSNAKWFVWQVWKSWHCTTENDFYATAVGVLLFRAASEQQTAAAARRSKCRAGKKTSKGPPEALWFMEAHRKRFKFEERWGYCHLFMRTSQPMIMGCHDICRRILILNCIYDTMLYDRIWCDMIRYDNLSWSEWTFRKKSNPFCRPSIIEQLVLPIISLNDYIDHTTPAAATSSPRLATAAASSYTAGSPIRSSAGSNFFFFRKI